MTDSQRITLLVEEIERLRLKRKRSNHAGGKRFSQDELVSMAYSSYKNMLLGRTQRLPDRAALVQIADYLECTAAERNALLRAAQYAPDNAPDAQRRKLTTILMGSVFISLDPAMDIEDAAGIMQSLWERLERIIVEHRGLVAERTGNIVLALWSTETTHEDDPEQAVRAALAMQAELTLFEATNASPTPNPSPVKREGPGLGGFVTSHFAVHTGQVLQTTGRHGQVHAYGEAVNVASQLNQAGPANSVLVSAFTHALLRDAFEVVPVDAAYQIMRAKSILAPIGTRTLESPLVGRSEVLATLQDMLRTVRESGQTQIITIVAEAGIGKSRLLHEFDNWLIKNVPDTFRFKGRSSQTSQRTPFALLRSLLSVRFEIADDDSPELARQKIEIGFRELNADAEKASYIIAHLIGFDFSESPSASSDPQEFFEIALNHLAHYFKAAAAKDVVVILLEDAHWTDESSLNMIRRLSSTLHDRPVLVIATTRTAIHFEGGTTLALRPLAPQESHELLDNLLGATQAIPAALREKIIDSSDGNPLYLEELVKMLRVNGAVDQVPATLTALLQARVDNLTDQQQHVLHLAAVLGHTFWDGSIKSLTDTDSDLRLSVLLDELCQQGLIFRQRKSTFRGYTEYTFKHALLRDVIYDSILKHDRLAYHAAAAHWLITVATRNQRLDECAGLIAHHFKCAERLDDACQWYRRAGKAAADRFANAEALAHLTSALDLLPASHEVDRYTLLATRERVYDALGLRDEQAVDLDRMFTLAAALANTPYQVETIVRKMNYSYLMGDKPEVARLAHEGIRLAQLIGSNEYQASSYVILGNVLWDQADYAAADSCFERALELISP